MSLQKRVEQLEREVGSDDFLLDDFLLIVVTFLEPIATNGDPGSEYCREVTGYSAVGTARKWMRLPAESSGDLRARVKADLKAEGHKVFAVCETYDEA